jgi:hypothetical protein
VVNVAPAPMEIAPGSVKTMAPPEIHPVARTIRDGPAAARASVIDANRQEGGVATPVGGGTAIPGDPFASA